MGLSTLRRHYATSQLVANAPAREPDFRELYKASQRELDATKTELALLRASLEPAPVDTEGPPPTIEPEPVADPEPEPAPVDTENPAPRRRR